VGGRWREFIVPSAATGSRCIWNITAVRLPWTFYEKCKRLEKIYHCISLLSADTSLFKQENPRFFLLAGENVFIYP
jgi:hypothetical protein